MLSPETDFETCDISTRQNRASINAFLICLLPSADDVQTSLGAGSRCKGSELFWIEQENSDFFANFSLEDTLLGATI